MRPLSLPPAVEPVKLPAVSEEQPLPAAAAGGRRRPAAGPVPGGRRRHRAGHLHPPQPRPRLDLQRAGAALPARARRRRAGGRGLRGGDRPRREPGDGQPAAPAPAPDGEPPGDRLEPGRAGRHPAALGEQLLSAHRPAAPGHRPPPGAEDDRRGLGRHPPGLRGDRDHPRRVPAPLRAVASRRGWPRRWPTASPRRRATWAAAPASGTWRPTCGSTRRSASASWPASSTPGGRARTSRSWTGPCTGRSATAT